MLMEITDMAEMLIAALGWLGGLAFMVSSIPQTIKCVRQGHTEGLSTLLIVCWLIGSGCLFAFVGLKSNDLLADLPLLFNYGLTFLSSLILSKYAIKPTNMK